MYGEIGGEVAILYRQTTGDKETETYEETVRKYHAGFLLQAKFSGTGCT
jgi:hypothetical protein